MLSSTNTYQKNCLTLYTNPKFKKDKQIVNNGHIHTPLAFDVNRFEDINYDQISGITHNGFHKNKIYVCEMLGLSSYKYLEYLEISHSISDTLLVNVEVNFRLSRWNEVLNLLNFVSGFRSRINDKHGIHSIQENLFDEDLIHIKFQVLMTTQSSLTSIVQRFSKTLASIHEDVLSSPLKIKAS